VLAFSDESLEDILPQFIEAVGMHRHFERETDPPRV
jgi:hypothetical protein